MPSNRVIIDTDPGVDDVLAILLALASRPEEVEVLLLSITFGNIDVQNCLRNVISMFHVIEKELRWRQNEGIPEGFEALRRLRPVVAVGADGPLDDQRMMADYFHGKDGLGGVHSSHPHHTPAEDIWKDLFKAPPSDTLLTSAAVQEVDIDPTLRTSLFIPSHRPSHLEILRILDENPPETITIIAIGPLTNLALAASHAPTTVMRAKSILVMGGTISVPGNMTPVAEFNTYADTVAAARLYALTSPNPASTMPPSPPPARSQLDSSKEEPPPPPFLPPYPSKQELGPRRLRVVLFPLDITTPHYLRRDEVEAKVKPLIEKGSPLAEWTGAFLGSTFNKMETLEHGHEGGIKEKPGR
ncbi:Inosine/uridine-preferring nucleoside hydrolase domain [Lasallia pustulata]|uniref:Inosine/uridine-preferring nucleoside hydrolase domain n=1 Tax=Lasallia pustulata TaxID=136370 RepID=A0A1W5D6W6_9LECA|nr:Inosine/uridine-preferring nucleoside hydrolase domain [Lasallia pustulata]